MNRYYNPVHTIQGPGCLAELPALLRQMLQQMRELRELAEGYYTRPRSEKYTTAGLRAPRRDPLK